MAICRSCSGEINGPDRYCRNCGSAVMPAVAELDDTHRFIHPSAPLPGTAGRTDNTNPLYTQYPGYASPEPQSPPSLIKNLFGHNRPRAFWWTIALIFLLFGGFWYGIGRAVGRHRRIAPYYGAMRESREERHPVVDPVVVRHKYEEAVQNALGFKQGLYSVDEFPETQGILVNNLMSDDSPAALAKIQAGDLLTELNDKQTRNDNELSQVLDTLKTGDEVPVSVYRDGSRISLKIKIADRAFPPPQTKIEERDQGFLGILDSYRRTIPGTKKWAVEVKDLHPNGPAELFGLRPGDIITEFNGHPVKTPNEFNRNIRAIKPGAKVVITFNRSNIVQKIELILGHRWQDLDRIMARRRDAN